MYYDPFRKQRFSLTACSAGCAAKLREKENEEMLEWKKLADETQKK